MKYNINVKSLQKHPQVLKNVVTGWIVYIMTMDLRTLSSFFGVGAAVAHHLDHPTLNVNQFPG